MLGYNTITEEDRKNMLSDIGVNSIEDLFSHIPEKIRFKKNLDLPKSITEWELEKKLRSLADKNSTTKTHLNFIGAGAYEHHIPAAIDAIMSRSEYITAYTPYQPEMNQGLLQALYEYQTAISKITGLPIVNSSCYDGATALVDAAWISCLISEKEKKKNILVSKSIWEDYKKTLQTYMRGREVEIHILENDKETGKINPKILQESLKKFKPSGFIFQTPNAFGIIEESKDVAEICRKENVVSILSFNPLTSGLFTPPGEFGIDIITGSAQTFGIPLNAGGSGLGIFATHKKYIKYVPGRLVGKIKDIKKQDAYALVYEEREQHIAREKATSNICSNQATNAIRAVIYLSLMGDSGLRKLAELNSRKAHYLCNQLTKIEGISLLYSGKFFNEFLLKLPVSVEHLQKKLSKDNIFIGVDVTKEINENAILVTVTETKSKKELDHVIKKIKSYINN